MLTAGAMITGPADVLEPTQVPAAAANVLFSLTTSRTASCLNSSENTRRVRDASTLE